MTPQFQQTVWARLLVGTILRSGVEHAVVSPGSRSTPFLVALLSEPDVRVHTIIDERSAAFFAIGLARSAKQPVLLLCTSGTAAANYLPAIVEAEQSGVPLIVLTADRPVDAQHAHSPQTIDQTQLYGNHVRKYFELGEASAMPQAMRSLRRLLLCAVQLAVAPNPGPVHLNARARKPLQPCQLADDEDQALLDATLELLGQSAPQLIVGETFPAPSSLQPLAETCAGTQRGLIVCGYDAESPALDAEVLAKFAQITGYPVWVDVAHPLRWDHPQALDEHTLRCAELLWGCETFARRHSPDVVIQIGPIPTSSHWENWLERIGAANHFVLCRRGWPDPSGRASHVITGDPSKTLRACISAIEERKATKVADNPWFLEWRHVDKRVELATNSWCSTSEAQSELHAVRAVLQSCPRDTCIVLGNSLPLREADLVWPAGDKGLESFAIRGANGIDGVLSTAAGVAVGGNRPVGVLLGDISFLHDVGALYAARNVENPLAIVVLDNRGGRVFEQLPVFSSVELPKLAHWTTPHELNLEAAGAIYGIPTTAPIDLPALRGEVRHALSTAGAKLILVAVDPSSARLGAQSLREAVQSGIGS